MAAQLLFGTGNSVTFGSLNAGGVGPTQGFSKSALSNMQVGDLLVAWLGGQDSLSTTVVTPPSGWTRYGAVGGNPNWSASRDSAFWYYPLTNQAAIDSLPATISWSFSGTTGRGGFVVARATGIDLTAVEDSAATTFTTSGNGTTSTTVGGIVTVNDNTLLVGGVYRHNSANTSVPTCTGFMTAFQEYNTTPTSTPTVASTSAIMGYVSLATSGTTGPYTATFDQTGTSFGGELVAFKALSGGGEGPATPYIVGTPTVYATAAQLTSFTINAPTGLQDGDALILALSGQTPTATSDFTCSGWERISQPFAASSGGYRVIAFYALPVPVAADVTQPNFTFTSADSSIGGRIAAEMFIVRGAELSYLTDGYSIYGNSGQTVNLLQPNTTVAGDLVLAAYNAQFVSGIDYTVASGPAGMLEQNFVVSSTANQSKTTLAVYQQTIPSAGAVPAASLTWSGTISQSSGVTVAIRPLGSAPANSGLDIHYTSAIDTLAKAKLFYTSATDTLSTPQEIRPVPTGYASVTAMLAQRPFYVAHRGGSKDWPEMSLHAYTQSAFWGVGALELSLARTSDGVWFGLHDASLDRTSLNTGGGSGTTLMSSAMTWAEVQAYQIKYPSVTNSSSLPQPYMRWEEIIEAYYGTHVIFVDPKYAASYTAELLAKMDALPGNPTDHFVAKSYGQTGNVANTNGWPHDAAAHGYNTWGYFYEADYENGNLATYQGRYTILGMDYTATSAAWSAVTSYGKPVIGHIVPSAAAATTALGYGAVGLMVSGIQEAIPRSSNPSQS